MTRFDPPAREKACHNSHQQDMSAALIAFEDMINAAHAASRIWYAAAAQSAGLDGLNPLDIAVFLNLGRSAKPTSFTQLCLSARVEQPHLAHYALRKLGRMGLVLTARRGKEKIVELTTKGQHLHHKISDQHSRIATVALQAKVAPAQVDVLTQALLQVAGLYDLVPPSSTT